MLISTAYTRLTTGYCVLSSVVLPTAIAYGYWLTAHCLLPTSYFQLPSAYCLLPTAYCLLPTAYCLLPTAYCLLPNA
jgi:hypothetical protein